MDELKFTVYRGDAEIVLEIPIDEFDPGEDAIRSGHPDRWTPGCTPSVGFGDPIIKSIDGPSELAVGGTLTLTDEEDSEAQEKALEEMAQEAEEADMECRLEAMEDDYDYDYCKY